MWIANIAKPLRRVAIFGLGSMGARYFSIFTEDLHIEARDLYLCDLGMESFRRVPVARDPAKLLKEVNDIDFAVIATPATSHLELLRLITSHFPQAGILIEKPLTNGLLDVSRLSLDMFRRAIAVGYNWRFHPVVERLARQRMHIVDLTLYVADDMRRWPGHSYGMPLYEFSHEIDLVRVLTRDPVVVSATYSDSGYRITGNHYQGRWSVRIRHHDVPKGRWVRVRRDDGSRLSFSWPTTGIEGTYVSQLKNVLSAWTHSGRSDVLRCSLADGVGTALLLDQIIECVK